MAAITVYVPQGYPVGTTLGAYVDRVGDIQPQGTPVETAVVAADSTITFTTLTPGLPYQVGAVINGSWRSFLIEPPSATPVLSLYALSSELVAHEAGVTNVHGIADTSNLAPRISPAFSGSIGIPVYTLATRPAASIGEGKLIFVSDATVGTKLQWSDGSAWQSAIVLLNNLSSTIPDKLIWTLAGGAVVEVFGDSIAAGLTWSRAYTDEFTALDAGWTSRQGAGTWRVVAGSLEQTVNNNIVDVLSRAGVVLSDMRVTYNKVNPAGGDVYPQGVGYYVDANHALLAGYDGNDNTLKIWGVNSAGAATVIATGPSIPNQLTSSFRMTKKGNVITVEHFYADAIADPAAVPAQSFSYTLTGADATNYGAGGEPAAIVFGLFTPGTSFGIAGYDRWAYDTADPAQRDLMVAVTPASGSRTVRRLFGSFGGVFRSDFLQAADLTTKGDLFGATGPGVAARIPATGVGGNVLVEDPTVATGWKSGPAGTIEAVHVVGAGGEPAFQNSWVNNTAGYPGANFYKDRGRVYFGGQIKGGNPGTVAFTLPAGYRPSALTRIWLSDTYSLDVGTDGTCTIYGGAAADNRNIEGRSFRL